MEIDEICGSFIGSLPDESLDEEVPDAFAKLFEDGALAFKLGGNALAHAHVERFREQTSDIDARAEELFKRDRPAPNCLTTPSPAPDVVTEEDDEHLLQKMETSFDRKKRNYSIWMREQIALGKSAGELIDFAAKTDEGVARLLREVADEIEAA